MNQARSTVYSTLRFLTLAAACMAGLAHADEYSDVSQLLRAGKLAEALVKADGYLATKPTDPQMRFLKGVIQRNAGKQPEAIAIFTKLTEDFPELPEPYNNLAVLYAGQGQFDKARAALEMAIRTNPSYSTAHENLGDVYARLASQAYNKALQLDNDNAAVPPKLALIREVFKPNLSNSRAASAAPATTPAPAAPAAPSAPAPAAAAKPVAPEPPRAATTPVTPPVATMPSATPAKPAASEPPKAEPKDSKDTKDIEAAIDTWAKAWSAKDVPGYLSAYAKDFDPQGKQSRSAWEDERRKRITGKSNIQITLTDLSVTVNGNRAVVKFRQSYRADGLAVSSRKTLELSKTASKWLITKESTGS
jgi:tetratricopeptide (TPR) repeat protein